MTEITQLEIQKRVDLTEKLRTKELNPIEADELKNILEKEKKKAITGGDLLTVLAIAFLIGLVIDYLSSER